MKVEKIGVRVRQPLTDLRRDSPGFNWRGRIDRILLQRTQRREFERGPECLCKRTIRIREVGPLTEMFDDPQHEFREPRDPVPRYSGTQPDRVALAIKACRECPKAAVKEDEDLADRDRRSVRRHRTQPSRNHLPALVSSRFTSRLLHPLSSRTARTTECATRAETAGALARRAYRHLAAASEGSSRWRTTRSLPSEVSVSEAAAIPALS